MLRGSLVSCFPTRSLVSSAPLRETWFFLQAWGPPLSLTLLWVPCLWVCPLTLPKPHQPHCVSCFFLPMFVPDDGDLCLSIYATFSARRCSQNFLFNSGVWLRLHLFITQLGENGIFTLWSLPVHERDKCLLFFSFSLSCIIFLILLFQTCSGSTVWLQRPCLYFDSWPVLDTRWSWSCAGTLPATCVTSANLKLFQNEVLKINSNVRTT